MYQALYRKWRPKTFDEVVGQQHVTETLKNQVRSGRLSHAYLFIGSRGTGKTTCARILSRAVNCENPQNGNPCGECPACRGILEGTVMDVVELDAASNNGVDNVRALREEAVFSPTSVRKRVYIIDEVHMLSTAAFNALLKILEEPPEHLMFILATTELQKVPATILSRCQRHSFRRIDSETLSGYLESIAAAEHIGLTHDAAELLARLADGGVRDALSLLDQCSASETIDVDAVYNTMGLAGNRRVAEMLACIVRHDSIAALKLFSGMWMDGKNPSSLLGELSGLLRDVLMLRVAPKGAKELLSGAYDSAALEGFAGQLTPEELISAMTTLQTAINALRDAPNPKTLVELCLLSLCENAGGDSFASLRARISRLEEEMARGVPAQGSPAPTGYDRPETNDDRPAPEDEDEPVFFRDEIFEPEAEPPRPVPAGVSVTPTAKQETSAVKPEAFASPHDPGAEAVRKAVLSALTPNLSFLSGENTMDVSLEGDVLRMEVLPGFYFERAKKEQVFLNRASAAVSALCGRELTVQVVAKKPRQRQTRDVEELRAFPEVHFNDGK